MKRRTLLAGVAATASLCSWLALWVQKVATVLAPNVVASLGPQLRACHCWSVDTWEKERWQASDRQLRIYVEPVPRPSMMRIFEGRLIAIELRLGSVELAIPWENSVQKIGDNSVFCIDTSTWGACRWDDMIPGHQYLHFFILSGDPALLTIDLFRVDRYEDMTHKDQYGAVQVAVDDCCRLLDDARCMAYG